ncbi:MAG: UPF0182 family protein [Actinomycetota bacterium]
MKLATSRGRSRPRPLALIAVAVAVALLLLGGVANFYTDVLWFREVGFTNVFTTGILTRLGLGAAFGVAFALVLLFNLWIVQKITRPARYFSLPDQVLERYRTSLQPYTKWLVIGVAVVLGLFAGTGASVEWREYLLFSHATKFGGAVDPVFGRDIGFYVFRLPFHQFLFGWGFSTLVLLTVVVGLAHYFMGGIRPQAKGERVSPEVRAHLSVLLGLIVLLKAWGYRLDQFNLLYSPRGQVTGASYTDVNAQLPALKLLVVIAVVCAVFFFMNARLKNWLLPTAGIGLLALTSILAGGAYPTAVQRLRVTPNERKFEKEFIQRNIDATRLAYGLENVDVVPFRATAPLKATDIRDNKSTIENIRLWEPNVLVNSYVSLQRIKPYYEFLNVDVDRYQFDGGRRQVMLAAREISLRGLSTEARTWLNDHMFYTHGYGVVASRVDRVQGEGEPDFILKNIPPASSDGGPKVTQSQIYFGENQDVPFVIVNSNQPELDYPQGEEKYAQTSYDGTGGIPIGGVVKRAAFAWRFKDVNLLISSAVNSKSRLIFRRNIVSRVQRVAPFLRVDSDPYIAIVNGRLVWMLDAYTMTSMYPYSQRISFTSVTNGGVYGSGNYIRNSVKFIIDAKNGNIDGYAWDEKDPILASWMKVFPDLLKPKSALSGDALKHVRYPEALFMLQSDRYANYHVTDADSFYQKEDAWLVANDPTQSLNVPSGSVAGINSPVPPYYVLMRLPGEKKVDFVLVRPFTPVGRANMTAYMVAHGDPESYGRLVTYAFSRSDSIFGPEQIQARINQDPAVSGQVTLWNQQNSRVIYGNLLVVPLGESLLYVQPIFLQGQGSTLPELKRVVAVAGQKVRMGGTLAEALAAIFGAQAEEVVPGVTTQTLVELLTDAIAADARAEACLKQGDFACYGREREASRRALGKAAERAGAAPAPSPSPSPS